MVARLYPGDAVGGAPAYTGRALRQTQGPFLAGATAARPLGALSGVRPGTPASTVTATSTTWTVAPFAGVIDLQTAAISGPYTFAFDAAVTGTVTAAGGSARVDSLSVRVNDGAEGDGTVVAPFVDIVYTLSGSALPARSFGIANINVPATGGGSPTITWNAPYTVGAGAILPVPTTVYPASPYVGQYVDDASLGLLRWNGAGWTSGISDRSATITAFGTGWTATPGAGFVPRIRRTGNLCSLFGAVTLGASGAFTNVLTIPAAFQPATTATQFIATSGHSAGGTATLALTGGLLSVPSGYSSGTFVAGNVLPLLGSWWMD